MKRPTNRTLNYFFTAWLIALAITGALYSFSTTTATSIGLPVFLFIDVIVGCMVIGLILLRVRYRRKELPSTNDAIARLIATAAVLAPIVNIALIASAGTELFRLDSASQQIALRTATSIVGYISIAFALLLALYMKDVFWVIRGSSPSMDERQINERRHVFESSYKIIMIVVMAAVWLQSTYVYPAVKLSLYDPSRILPWYGISLIIIVLITPMFIAAWRKK